MMAAQMGSPEVVEALLEAGADLDAERPDGSRAEDFCGERVRELIGRERARREALRLEEAAAAGNLASKRKRGL